MSLPHEVGAVIRHEVERGALTGAVALLGGTAATAAEPFGYRREGGAPVTLDTRYDLASLTKVVATLPSVLRLIDRGELRLDDRLGRFFSNAGWYREPSLADTTVRELLTHSSGLLGWRPLFAEVSTRSTALAAVLQAPLEQPGRVVYSDLGFMLLGALVERVTGMRLDRFAAQEIFGPLGMRATRFGPLRGEPVAATEFCGWRGRLLEGEVHDENASVWVGVAGHAGLFGTADDLGRYARAWLERDPRLASEELLAEAVREGARGEDGAPRGLGWVLPWRDSFAGADTPGFGHSGFTGTSIWIDPEGESYAVLLSNRVHPHRERREGMHSLRQAFHGAWRRHMSAMAGSA